MEHSPEEQSQKIDGGNDQVQTVDYSNKHCSENEDSTIHEHMECAENVISQLLEQVIGDSEQQSADTVVTNILPVLNDKDQNVTDSAPNENIIIGMDICTKADSNENEEMVESDVSVLDKKPNVGDLVVEKPGYRLTAYAISSDSESGEISTSSPSSSSESDDDQSSEDSSSDEMSPNNSKTSKKNLKPKLTIDEALPKIEDLKISVEPTEVHTMGKILHTVGEVVVVQPEPDFPALDLDTVLFLKDGSAIGKIYDVFGPVAMPLYALRFQSAAEIAEKGFTSGMEVFCAKKRKEYTSYVFIEQLRRLKATDASWSNDRECPPQFEDYSDDEQEKRKNRRQDVGDGQTDADPSSSRTRQGGPKPRPDSGHTKRQHNQTRQGNPFSQIHSAPRRFPMNQSSGNNISRCDRPRFTRNSTGPVAPSDQGSGNSTPWCDRPRFTRNSTGPVAPALFCPPSDKFNFTRVPLPNMSTPPNFNVLSRNFAQSSSSFFPNTPPPNFTNFPPNFSNTPPPGFSNTPPSHFPNTHSNVSPFPQDFGNREFSKFANPFGNITNSQQPDLRTMFQQQPPPPPSV